jgi:hypothetical protein
MMGYATTLGDAVARLSGRVPSWTRFQKDGKAETHTFAS